MANFMVDGASPTRKPGSLYFAFYQLLSVTRSPHAAMSCKECRDPSQQLSELILEDQKVDDRR
jgi:hypothetical protein